MARFLYTLVIVALLPWAVLHLLWRSRRQPEYLQHWGERFGRYTSGNPLLASLPPIWLHAVLWGIIILALTIGTRRPTKAYIIALQYKHRPESWE